MSIVSNDEGARGRMQLLGGSASSKSSVVVTEFSLKLSDTEHASFVIHLLQLDIIHFAEAHRDREEIK